MDGTSDGAARATAHTRLSQLDGLRGIAALIIMMYHSELVFRAPGPFARGYLYVDLFFMHSGFVLAVSTERKLNAGTGALEFTWSRYKRLFALVAVGVAVAAARALAIGQPDPPTLLLWVALDLAMIPVLTGAGPFYRLNGPQWTLFWELVANFAHALVLRRIPTKVLPFLAAGFCSLLILAVSRHGSDTVGVDAFNQRNWWMGIPRVFFPYVLGVWMGRKHLAGMRTPALPWPLTMGLPVAAIMLVPSLPLGKAAGDLAFVILFLPLAMWFVVMCRLPARVMPAMDWLGNFSLPLYCVHLTVLVWVSELVGLEPWVRALAIAVSLVVAYAASRLISFQAKPTQVKAKPREA